ncbi:hypothetical protein ACVQ90_08985 [Staphylococcus aureus]
MPDNPPNEVLSFDDNGIRPSTNRSVPTVNVVNNSAGLHTNQWWQSRGV